MIIATNSGSGAVVAPQPIGPTCTEYILLLQLFITGQVDSGRIDDVGKPYPYGGEGYPYPDPLTGGSLADVVTGFFSGGRRARRRRRLADEATRSAAAASATQASK